MRIGLVMCALGLAGCWHGDPAPTIAAAPRIAAPHPLEEDGVDDDIDTSTDDEPDDHGAAAIAALTPSPAAACPSPPDASIAACRAIMPCPNPPDPGIAACGACDGDGPRRQRVTARVIGTVVTNGGEVIITIGAGKNSGVASDWVAWSCDANGTRLPNGEIKLIRVDRAISVGKSALTVDELQASSRVCMSTW